MPRVVRVDKTKFINPSLPKEYRDRLFLANSQAVNYKDKINFALYKYEILRSLEFLIFNDVNLASLSKEELDFLFDDLSKKTTRTLFLGAFRSGDNYLKSNPAFVVIESFFHIYKYDRLCAKESQSVCDDITVSEYIRKYDNECVRKKIETYLYFDSVFRVLSKDFKSDDFEKKLFSSIILNDGFNKRKFSSFSNKILKSLSKEYKENFDKYYMDIIKLTNISFEDFKQDVVSGNF